MIKLSISIVSWNTCELLRDCLGSLLQYCDVTTTEIFVVDNASSDDTTAMLRTEFPQIRLIESGGNLGFGKGHNLVASYSRAPLMLFLNPDCRFVEDSITPLVQVFDRHADVGLVGCRIINREGATQSLGFQCHTSPWSEVVTTALASRWTLGLARRVLPFHDPFEDGYVRKLYGGCLAARRTALDSIGWFDQRFFMYAEDVDLSRRAEAAGWRLYYVSGTKVMHHCGGASAKAPGRFSVLMQCESLAQLMDKHYGRHGRILYRLVVLGRAVSRLLISGAAVMLLAIVGRRKGNQGAAESWKKNLAILKWGLGLERPAIPK